MRTADDRERERSLGKRRRAARRGIVAVFVAGWLLALLPGVARAATLTVCTQGPPTCQYGFLRQAVSAAQDGDTITIAAGHYTANQSDATISVPLGTTALHLTIVGAGAGVTILDGSPLQQTVLRVRFGVTLDLSGVTITGGTGSSFSQSGGINNYGTVHVADSIITGNQAGPLLEGGGIFNFGVLTLTNTTVSNNTAADLGGGIATHYGGDATKPGRLTITNSVISGNTAGNGGGFENVGGAALSNVTISGNTASSNGGGILTFGRITLTDVTLSGNTASTAGGGVDGGLFGGVNITANNTIIAGNTAPTNPDLNGILVSGGHNLIGGDPRLDVLGRNPGEATDTMPPFPGSPALDAGDDAICAAPLPTGPNDPPGAGGVDQRGVPRPWGGALRHRRVRGALRPHRHRRREPVRHRRPALRAAPRRRPVQRRRPP